MNFLIKLKEDQRVFAKYLKTTDRTVRDALLGKTKSSWSNMIRRVAVEHGADVFVKVSPDVYLKNQEIEFDSYFNTSEKQWVMTFSDRVSVVADLATDAASILVDGKTHTTFHGVTMSQLPKVHAAAQRLANEFKTK